MLKLPNLTWLMISNLAFFQKKTVELKTIQARYNLLCNEILRLKNSTYLSRCILSHKRISDNDSIGQVREI